MRKLINMFFLLLVLFYYSCDSCRNIFIPCQYKNLFMGDSIAALGNWENYFSNMTNGGISGSTAQNWIAYGNIFKFKDYYTNVYIFLGVNDLGKGFSIESTISNYKQIIEYLKIVSGNIYAISVMSINISLYTQAFGMQKHAVNMPDSLVVAFNSNLINLVNEMNIEYIDIYSIMVTNEEMNPKYTDDGIHPDAIGYYLVAEKIKSK